MLYTHQDSPTDGQKGHQMKFIRLNLQLFTEAGTAGPVDQPAAEITTGVSEGDAAPQSDRPLPRGRKSNPLASVQYGIQDNPTPAPQQDGAAESEEDAWKAAKEKFRSYYDREMQTAVQARVKNTKISEERLSKLEPVLSGLYEQYGVQAGDVDALVNAFNNDDTRLADEAIERGVSVETLKQIKSLERDHAELERIRAQNQEEQQFQRHIGNLIQQAEKLKQTVPGFDLRTELQNEEFRRLTSPQIGVSVEQAYYVVHRREIDAGAQMAAGRLAQAQAANAARPTENGLIRSAAVEIKSDPSKWSKKDREEVRRRVRMGEKIRL